MQKRLRRYVLSTLLVMVLLLGAAFVVMTSETVVAEQDGDYTYTVAGSPLVATITDYTGADSIITIPSTLGGYPAVVIGQNAFQQCRFLTSVTIPNNVTTIGEYAFFSCTYLTSMTIGSGVTTIGD
ncbi:MAG: leucine-rich repeat domain-containing protein, partial [Methanomassiliicoccales archaeon]